MFKIQFERKIQDDRLCMGHFSVCMLQYMHNEYHVILECMIIFYQTSMRRFSIRFVTCFWLRFWRQKSFCYASSLMGGGGGGGGGAIGIVCVCVEGGGAFTVAL